MGYQFLFEFGGWFFTGLLGLMIGLPLYWKHKDKVEDKKIREANREYYEHLAKKAGVELKMFGY